MEEQYDDVVDKLMVLETLFYRYYNTEEKNYYVHRKKEVDEMVRASEQRV